MTSGEVKHGLYSQYKLSGRRATKPAPPLKDYNDCPLKKVD
jgi:hypothetical protein